MKHKLFISIYDLLFLCLILSMIGYFAVLPIGNINIRHVFVFIGSVNVYLLALSRLAEISVNKKEIQRFLLFFVIYLLQFVFSLKLNSEAIYAWLNFLSFYIILTTQRDYRVTKKHLKLTLLSGIIIGIILLYLYFSPVAFIMENGRSNGALALGMTNTNFTSIMISAVLYLIAINIGYIKRKLKKGLFIVLIIVLLYFIYLTQSRTSLVVASLTITYIIFFKDVKIPNFIVIVVLAFPFAFAKLYVSLYKSGMTNQTIMGKELFSGREYIFEKALYGSQSIIETLFGNFGGCQFSNAHNGALSILTTIGYIGMIIVYFNSGNKLISINKNGLDSSVSRICFVCILSFFLESCTEGVMFTGIFPGVGFIYIYNVFMSYKDNNNSMYIDKKGSVTEWVKS